MSKNINVKLTFSADTKAAQQQIHQLQQTLSNIVATPVSGGGLKATAQEIQVATNKALELKVALNNATNVNTGKLNFNKFSQELKRNKTTLQQYAMQLQKLGPQGVQAFSQMATAIRQSETPLVAMQGRLAALGQTFMNTVKWSISSSMIQGVTKAFSSTIDYAKELNKNLNNIRIVTGKSIDDVSKFAIEANKAAKALSATTDEYTKASLIYFQQGLGDKAVAERTETTLKLAKVVGESAETASEWMTAIWNNFDDGSRSLEEYADVLAKLGASTASSADEIAGGLEKFVSVADTVGLSFDYAAAALATITAETRQSEEVVGTALKTIFARVENLKLGETLEDGTSLGEYSQALEKVGVTIKDSNGNLKDMDVILSDIGATWGVLNRDQQVALAQQVAGIRQYNQFMALMDNWDVMEENVKLSKEANGELEKQHDIWETGIEGATSRVQEELNEIKNSLLGENDLLPILNIAEGFLDFIGDLIDSLGGLPGLLSIIASVGLKLWGPQAAAGLQSMVSGVKSLYSVASGSAQADRSAMVKESAGLSAKMFTDSGMGNEEAATASKFSKDNAARVIDTEKAQGTLNSAYKETLQLLEQIIQKRQEEAQLAAQNVDKATDDLGAQKDSLANKYGEEKVDWDKDAQKPIKRIKIGDVSASQMNEELDKAGKYENNIDNLGRSGQRTASLDKEAASILQTSKRSLGKGADKKQIEAVKQQETAYKKLKTAITDYDKVNTKANRGTKEGRKLINDAKESLKDSTNEFKKASKQVKTADNTIKKYNKTTGISTEELKGVVDASTKEVDAIKKADTAKKNAEKTQDNYNKKLEEGKKAGQGWTTSFVNGMQGVASAAAGVQMMVGAVDSLSTSIADGTFGFSEFLSALTSVGFALPMVLNGLKTINSTFKISSGLSKLFAAMEEKRAAKAIANAAKHKTASEIEQSSDKMSVLAKLAKWFAEGPPGWAIAATAITAIAGLGIAIAATAHAKKTASQEEEADNKAIETAEGALEVAEGWNEESQAMDNLIAKHNELKKANDQTIEGQKALKEAKQAIIDQVPQLIKKYKELDEEYEDIDLSADVKVLEGAAKTGDVEQIERVTNEIDEKIASKTSQIAQEGQKSAMGRTAAAMAEVQGSVNDGKYTVHVGGAGSDVENLIAKSNIGASNGNDITLDMSNSKSFLKDYEELQKIAETAKEKGYTDDDAYREIKEVLGASEEQYNKLKELIDKGRFYEIQTEANQIGFDPSNIQTYTQYINEKERLVKATVDAGIATKEEAEAWIEANTALSEFASVEKIAVSQAEKYGEAFGNSIEEYAKTLNNREDLTAFLKIKFNKFQVQEQWDELTEYIKHIDKGDKLSKDVTSVTSAEKNLKAKGTVEDYKKLQESLNWGYDGLIKYSDFLSKSYGQQKAYLEDIKIRKANAAKAEYQAALAQLQLTQQQYILQLKQAELAGDTALQKKINIDLQNLKSEIESTKILIELSNIEVRQAKDAKAQRLRDLKRSRAELDKEIGRYRLLNEQVEDLERNIDAITTAKERAFGGTKLAYMKQERKLLQESIELEEKRLEQSQKYLSQDVSKLAQYGIELDKNGQVINWDVRLQEQINKLKGMSDTDTQEYKNEKQKLEDMKDAYDQYMTTLDEVKDYQQSVIDKQNAVIDSLLEEAEFTVEFKIEADEFTMSILEHFLSRLEDDAFAAADAIALIGQQMEVTAGQVDTYMTGINNVLGATLSPEEIQKVMAGNLSNIDTSKLTEQQIEDLKEYANGLMEVENQLREQHTAVHEKLTESIEAWNEEFDKNMAKFEKYNAVVENYKNIIDIVGKDRLGISDETMRNMYDTQKKIANDQLASAKARKESAQFTYDEIKAAYDNAVALYGEDSEIAKKWKEQMEAAEETLNDATNEFYDSWQNALQAAADAFAASVETIVENFEKSVSGAYDSLDALQEAFDRQKEINERYLDTYEKTYEINKLNRKINQDIAKTINIKSQKELRNLQEQLLDLNKEGSKVSERDIQFMQKKYDLLVAEQALRDAQNAKSTVKLSRDSEGNYSYVYTADQSNIDAATQTYEDAAYNLEKWNEETLITISEQIITIKQNFAQAIQDIANDANLSDEERKRKMEETTIYYTGQLKYWTDEAVRLNEYATQANSQFHMDMGDSVHESIVGQIMPDIVDWEELYRTDSEAMQKASDDLDKAIDVMAYDIDKAMGEAGTSVEDFRENANEDFLSVQSEAEKTKGKITELKSTIETELPKATNAVQTFETQFNSYMDLIIQKIGSLTGGGVLGAIQNLINGCKEGLAAQKALEEKNYSYTGSSNTSYNDSGSSGGGNTSGSPNISETPTDLSDNDFSWVKVAAHNYSGENFEALGRDGKGFTGYLYRRTNGEYVKSGSVSRAFTERELNNLKWKIVNNQIYNGKGGLYVLASALEDNRKSGVYKGQEWLIPTNNLNKWGLTGWITIDSKGFGGAGAGRSFDTGGYTGEWGPEGRLAMLHQKEIVLNAHDTENLLSIVSMVRDMNDRIELNARAMQYGLTAAYTANNIKSQNDTLQQEVHITAEFPNATNHSEIEEAFRNLTNLASQYANRKF